MFSVVHCGSTNLIPVERPTYNTVLDASLYTNMALSRATWSTLVHRSPLSSPSPLFQSILSRALGFQIIWRLLKLCCHRVLWLRCNRMVDSSSPSYYGIRGGTDALLGLQETTHVEVNGPVNPGCIIVTDWTDKMHPATLHSTTLSGSFRLHKQVPVFTLVAPAQR